MWRSTTVPTSPARSPCSVTSRVHERANGRLYVSADFALPRDVSQEDQVALARSFAQELTAAERLPYTLAVHAGKDAGPRP
jgi:hypothetical protein